MPSQNDSRLSRLSLAFAPLRMQRSSSPHSPDRQTPRVISPAPQLSPLSLDGESVDLTAPPSPPERTTSRRRDHDRLMPPQPPSPDPSMSQYSQTTHGNDPVASIIEAYRQEAHTERSRRSSTDGASAWHTGPQLESGHSGRRRRRRRRTRWVPKHSRGKAFFPAMKYGAVRDKFFHTVVAGALLLVILIIFLALTRSASPFGQEFRIITILFLLVFIVLFLYSFIRLLLLLRRLKKTGTLSRNGSTSSTRSAIAYPETPVRIVLARDEEIGIGGAGMEDPEAESDNNMGAEAKESPLQRPPPAYGQWRSSVRIDPNLIHWQRVEGARERPLSAGTIHEPPEYNPEVSADLAAANEHYRLDAPRRAREQVREQAAARHPADGYTRHEDVWGTDY